MPRTSSLRRSAAVILSLCAVVALVDACSSSGTTTSTSATGTTGTTALTTATTSGDGTTGATGTTQAPIVANPAGNAIARELKSTARAVAVLGAELQAANVADNDPRLAQLYGLRARAQALTVQRALLDKQAALADTAALQLVKLLGQGVAIAQEPALSTLERAQRDLAGLGVPSTSPDTATPKLIAAAATLAAMLPPATGTTTTSGAATPGT